MMEVVYIREEQECYENLHIQTKQFKDDISAMYQLYDLEGGDQ